MVIELGLSGMSSHVFRARRWVLILVAGSSPLIASLAVWAFAPTSFRELSTFELGAVAALLVLPMATAGAVLIDRRRTQQCEAPQPTPARDSR